jgi:hypothetical protein
VPDLEILETRWPRSLPSDFLVEFLRQFPFVAPTPRLIRSEDLYPGIRIVVSLKSLKPFRERHLRARTRNSSLIITEVLVLLRIFSSVAVPSLIESSPEFYVPLMSANPLTLWRDNPGTQADWAPGKLRFSMERALLLASDASYIVVSRCPRTVASAALTDGSKSAFTAD